MQMMTSAAAAFSLKIRMLRMVSASIWCELDAVVESGVSWSRVECEECAARETNLSLPLWLKENRVTRVREVGTQHIDRVAAFLEEPRVLSVSARVS